MAVSQLSGAGLYTGLITRNRESYATKQLTRSLLHQKSSRICNFYALLKGNKVRYTDAGRCSLLMLLSSPIMGQRKRPFSEVKNKLSSDFRVQTSDMEESSGVEEEYALSNSEESVHELMGISSSETSEKIKDELTRNPTTTSHPQDLNCELIMMSLPVIAGQAIEPFSQLMETAYIGRLGPVELASAGVSLSIFNIISKLFNIPLLSVATSFVAEDISKNASPVSLLEESREVVTNGKPFDSVTKREQLSSVSTALLLAVGIGLFEAIALSLGSGVFLNLMGILSVSLSHNEVIQDTKLALFPL